MVSQAWFHKNREINRLLPFFSFNTVLVEPFFTSKQQMQAKDDEFVVSNSRMIDFKMWILWDLK